MSKQFNTRYNEVKEYIIAEHGTPKTGILNGRKHIVINVYLNSYEAFLKTFLNCLQKCKINTEDVEEELLLVLDFCKDAEYTIIDNLTTLLQTNGDKTVVKKILLNLNQIKNEQQPEAKVVNCFKTSVKQFYTRKVIYSGSLS